MKDGEYKFRQNNKWDVNYGGTATAGILTDKDGANIKIKAGKYKITANFNKLTYTVEAQYYFLISHIFSVLNIKNLID